MRSSMEWRYMSFIFVQKSFQFPLDGGWRNGFKIRKDFLVMHCSQTKVFVEFQYVGNIWNSGKPLIVLCFCVECGMYK